MNAARGLATAPGPAASRAAGLGGPPPAARTGRPTGTTVGGTTSTTAAEVTGTTVGSTSGTPVGSTAGTTSAGAPSTALGGATGTAAGGEAATASAREAGATAAREARGTPGRAAAPTGRTPVTSPERPGPGPGFPERAERDGAAPALVRRPGPDFAGHPGSGLPRHPRPRLAGHPERRLAQRAAPDVAPAPSAGEQAGQAAPWSSDPYADALRVGRGPLYLRRTDGWLLPLDVERWCARADTADLEVLRRCEGAVLDVGCGPGRLIAALAAQGRRALGVDISEAAVAHTVRLGGQALHRSVFDPVPGEGRWGTALLIDGNLGIGGDPAALLDRMDQLLTPGGLLIVETVPVDVDERVRVRVADDRGAAGATFPWARLGTPALLRHAGRAGWHPDGQWSTGDRSFVALRSRGASGTARPPDGTTVTGRRRVAKPVAARPVAERPVTERPVTER
ncbi:methyltransferase domain-containing protein [Streptomyces sp. NPDC059466]|uniref:methyltransferase domain-containing protein n=1 Tax=Streptomyces sp. NPDC059466 TaxID=3346843 RepID=UPI00367EBE77